MIQKIQEATKILLSGGIILTQTDTVYGLLCLPQYSKSLDRLKKIKKREKNVFSLFVSDINMAEQICIINKKNQSIFEKVFPGYFTLIFGIKAEILDKFDHRCFAEIHNKYTIGIRVPKFDFCLELCKLIGPIVATSANISGQNTTNKLEKIDKNVFNLVDYIFTSEPEFISNHIHSTVIDLTNDLPKILRNGSGDFDFVMKNFLNK